jgi:uncharacterized membrane protein YjfL (UPF0719 family)
MLQLGPIVPFYIIVLIWIAKSLILASICTFLGWLGIRILDALTPKIHKRVKIGEHPVSVGIFIAGFFIFIGLILHGTLTRPIIVGAPLLKTLIDFERLAMIALSFFVSLLFGVVLFDILDRLMPKIPFRSVNKNPIAVGVYVFGYLVFFGLIIHAALTTSL